LQWKCGYLGDFGGRGVLGEVQVFRGLLGGVQVFRRLSGAVQLFDELLMKVQSFMDLWGGVVIQETYEGSTHSELMEQAQVFRGLLEKM
jgi:hypothetical protein